MKVVVRAGNDTFGEQTMRDCTHIILVAEDDPDDRELIATAFSSVDPSVEVHIVCNGREVVDYLHNRADNELPCVILLDYNMPELNGAQVLQELQPDERLHDIPKIILSTSDNPQYVEDSLRRGAKAWRVKPDHFGGLVRIAREMAELCSKAA